MKPVGVLNTFTQAKYWRVVTTTRGLGAVRLFDGECSLYSYDESNGSVPAKKLTKWIQMS